MEPESIHITKEHVRPDAAPERAPYRTAREIAHPRLDAPAHVRLGLQRHASTNIRRHLLRAVRRFVLLLVADLASFYVMRELVRAVRDHAVLSEWVAGRVHSVVPSGILNGWQYAAALFVGLFVTGNYGPGDRRRDAWRLFLGCALATALPLWMAIWTRGLETVLVQYALITVLVWGGLALERGATDWVVRRVRSPERERVDALFVGPGPECVAAMGTPAFGEAASYRPIGFVDTDGLPMAGALGQLRDFPLLLDASGAQAVVICGYVTEAQFRSVVDATLVGGLQLLSLPRSTEIAGVHPTTVWRHGQPLVELTAPSLKGWQLALKRALDLGGAMVGLALLWPFLLLLWLAVKLESRGPAIFGHRRLGLNGRSFQCLKFRSMYSDAEERLRSDPVLYAEYAGSNYKLPSDRDPRLTRIGEFLRKTSFDELPQLINVLKGEMSLVGPRPIVPEELAEYGHGAPAFLSLKPGVTGAWQVNGRSSVGYPARADIELEYVRNWSLGRDLWILLQTIPVVFSRRGAH